MKYLLTMSDGTKYWIWATDFIDWMKSIGVPVELTTSGRKLQLKMYTNQLRIKDWEMDEYSERELEQIGAKELKITR